MFNNSRIRQLLQNNEFDGHLLGDSGYPCRNYLLTPFLNPATDGQRRYNTAHIATRSIVERTFSIWKNRFRCLLTPLRLALANSQNVIIACACLNNYAIDIRLPHVEPEDAVPLPRAIPPHAHDHVHNFNKRNE